ncbi:MAG: serine hydrolase domain-containing protein [Candidatus Nanopelagicales bacterium]
MRARTVAGVVAVGLLAAACSSSTTTGGGSSTTPETSGSSAGSASGPAAPASTCVQDPAAAYAAQQSPESLTAALPEDLVSSLDAAVEATLPDVSAPGIVAGVRTPEGTWVKAYGSADWAGTTPMTDDVHQRIGSVTKTITGTVILQLAQEGKLSLDDTIDQYVEGMPNGDTATLRMLADMTSGIASYTFSSTFTDSYFADPEQVFTPDQLLDVARSLDPLFEAGTQYNYSNTNTILLGKVIEKVTGQDVADVFQERVFGPLGLTGTSWPGESPDLPEPHATGYSLQGSGTPENPADATFWNPAWGWTAGEAISTVRDLLVYGRAIGTGQGLLDEATQTERLTSFPGEAGYGLAMGCVAGWVGHTGELPGFNTSVFYDTGSDTTVIVMANSDIASGDCTESPVLPDNPTGIECRSPATRVFVSLSEALGSPFTPPPLA